MAIVLPKLSRFRSSGRTAADTPPALTLTLCHADGRYQAGQRLRANWRIGRLQHEEVVGLEASVLWFTEGKGDEDLQVHHFERWNDAQLNQLNLSVPHSIECVLPLSPMSYEGTLVRIRWCVRLRLFCSSGHDCVTQQSFQLMGYMATSELQTVS